MRYTTLDAIVRNFLIKRRYTMHDYIDALVAAKDCLRELHLSDLRVSHTKLLPVNAQNAVDLPSDYVDYVRVGVRVGQSVQPLMETDKINALVNRDSSFNPTTYNATDADDDVVYGFVFPYYWNGVNYNSYGENTGRAFGYGAGAETDVFSVFKERNQIQLAEGVTYDHIVLEYISGGGSPDAATKVPIEAYATIEAYIMWQHKENHRSYGEGERMRAKDEYINQRQILRARMSNLTMEVIKHIIQRSSTASPK